MAPTIHPHFACRIVVCGSKLKRSILSNSAGIYNFQRAFQLDQEEVSQAPKAELAQAAGLSLSL